VVRALTVSPSVCELLVLEEKRFFPVKEYYDFTESMNFAILI